MASLGAHIIIAGQNELKGVSAVKRICEENREAKVEFDQLNLASLQSVRQFVQSIKRRGLPLHILVNNVFRQCYSAHAAYSQSKLALLLFSSHLQQRLDRGGFPVSSWAVDPGMVDTSLYCHLFTTARLARTAIARLLFRSPSQGTSTVLYTALSPSLEGEEGAYWSNGCTEMTSPNTYDPQLHRGLWDSSCRQVGLP
uniref:dehydrogenase/reductase SDR family member on chromosome X-like n=1 Tax=Oncorhynchus gorbuscha TaxID=8017 RepID=UPI001EAF16F6|nr:dehydrogenase/reductase SDR family member on chromosome X-like [Oncorhynchus gorbuscha]